MTRRFPSTSTTVVKIKMLAKVAITQAGRVFPSSGRPSSVLVRLCRRGSASGITTAPLWANTADWSPAHTARHSDTLARTVHLDLPMAPKQLIVPALKLSSVAHKVRHNTETTLYRCDLCYLNLNNTFLLLLFYNWFSNWFARSPSNHLNASL